MDRTLAHARLRELKAAFDAAHERGMDAILQHADDALAEAIRQERAIIEEQGLSFGRPPSTGLAACS